MVEVQDQSGQQVLDAINPVSNGHLPAGTIQRMPASASLPAALDPAALLQVAVQRGDGIDMIERLMDLKDRHDKKIAEQAFNAAFAAFKAEAVVLIRSKLINDGPLKGKKHAELSDAVNAATPALSKHGLSVSWRLSRDEKDWIEVTCTVRHVAGHSESVSMGGAPDAGPGRNAIQARGSVKTYLERYTYTAILGLAAQDADDDGAGGAPEEGPEAGVMKKLIAEVQMTASDAEASGHWRAHNRDLIGWPYAYEKYKDAVVAHRKALAAKSGASA